MNECIKNREEVGMKSKVERFVPERLLSRVVLIDFSLQDFSLEFILTLYLLMKRRTADCSLPKVKAWIESNATFVLEQLTY